VILKRDGIDRIGFDETHSVSSWKPNSSVIDHTQLRKLPSSRYERRKSPALLLAALLVAVSAALALSTLTPYAPLHSTAQATYDHDVAATSINSPSGTAAPGNVTVDATVANAGNLPSGQFQVNLSVTQSGIFVPTFNDSFESGALPPPGWGDYTSGSQLWISTLNTPHTGLRCERVGPEFWGTALLGSPGISISSNSVLTFWSKYVPSGGLSELYVTLSFIDHSWASLWDSPNATLGVLDTGAPGGIGEDWAQFSYDLSTYAGDTVYIGFVHTQPSIGSDVYLDDVMVGDPNGTIMVFSDEVQVSNLVAGDSTLVEFGPWNATVGNYTLEVNTYLVGDENATNDLISENVTIEVVVIPEFPTIIAPALASTVVMVGVLSRRRRK